MARRQFVPHALLALTVGCSALVVTSISMPSWVVSNVAESIELGVLRTCRQGPGQRPWCGWSSSVHGVWHFVIGLSVCGVLVQFATAVLLTKAIQTNPRARRHHELYSQAKWVSLGAFMIFCLGMVLFPVGFSLAEIGGTPYRLPPHMNVGLSYQLYFVAVLISLLSQILCGRYTLRFH